MSDHGVRYVAESRETWGNGQSGSKAYKKRAWLPVQSIGALAGGFQDELIITATERPADGILGRLLVIDKEGNSFQIVLKRSRGLVCVDIHNNLQVHNTPSQNLEQQEYERDRIVSILDNGSASMEQLIRELSYSINEKHIMDVVEIEHLANSAQGWLRQVAVLEGYIEEKPLLSYATIRGSEAVIKLLYEAKKYAIDLRTESGLTSLVLAVEKGHEAVVKLLLEKNADLESKSRFDWPLTYAAWIGNEAAVQLLLERGAGIEV